MDLIDMVIQGDEAGLKLALEQGANPEHYECDAQVTLLHYAVLRHHYSLVKLLLAHGANPYRCDKVLDLSPVDIAILENRDDIFWLLISSKTLLH